MKRSTTLGLALAITVIVTAGAKGNPDPAQMIRSMEINKSAGNMTADDYAVQVLPGSIDCASQELAQLRSGIQSHATVHLPPYRESDA